MVRALIPLSLLAGAVIPREAAAAPAADQLDPNSANPALERSEETVLVLNLRNIGVSAEEALAASVAVAEALASHTRMRVMSAREIDELVEHQKTLSKFGCDDDACIAEMSRIANATRVLSGSIGRIGGELIVGLHLTNTETNESVGGASRSMSALEALPEVLPGLLSEIFGVDGPGGGPNARFVLPEGEEISLAVFDLKPLGVSAETVGNLTQVLATEMKRIEDATVVSRDDIASMLELEAQKDQLDCADQISCLAEIGGALGVQKIVVGHAGQLGSSFVVSLRLIDARAVTVDSRVTATFRGQEEQLLHAVRFAGRELFGITSDAPGDLAVSATQQGAAVHLDGQELGVSPLPPVDGLTPGRHTLRLAKRGYLDWSSEFYIQPGGTTALWAEMFEEPESWYEKWWVWTAVGVVVIGAAGAITYAVLSNQDPDTDLGTRDL